MDWAARVSSGPQRLCDRVALIDRGRIVAMDSPAGWPSRPAAASGCDSFRQGRSVAFGLLAMRFFRWE